MNKQIIKLYIDQYKLNFEKINQHEIYKWKAVKCFQDNWDIEAINFHEMLSTSFSLVKNLLNAAQYFPKRMLLQYSFKQPEEIRNLFMNLYNEDNDIFERIDNFIKGINIDRKSVV